MLKVLGRRNSSNVQKVLWACGELGLDFEREDVGGPFGRNHDPEYLAMNPNAVVPTIVDDGFVLWESNVIVRYLAAKHAAGTLAPRDPHERALADQWMDWQQTVLGPAITPVFWGLVRSSPESRNAAAIEAGRERTQDALSRLDARLASADYVAGPRFTMGDIPSGIQAYRWFTMDVERTPLPNVERWYRRLTEREAFRAHVMIGLS